MDFWIPLLGSALGGALVTSIFGLVKSHQDKASEHAQWLRNQKVDVYTNLLRQTHASARASKAAAFDMPTVEHHLEDIADVTNARLMIVGSQEVRSKAEWHFYNLHRAFEATTPKDFETFERSSLKVTESRLEEAIREDLDVIEKVARKHSLRAWMLKHTVDPWRDRLYVRYYQKHGHAWAHRKGGNR
jgi:hypothetical protein